MDQGENQTRSSPTGELWREKASDRTIALTSMVLGQSVTCLYSCLLQTNSLQSTSRQKPIVSDRKGSPVGRLAVYDSVRTVPLWR